MGFESIGMIAKRIGSHFVWRSSDHSLLLQVGCLPNGEEDGEPPRWTSSCISAAPLQNVTPLRISFFFFCAFWFFSHPRSRPLFFALRAHCSCTRRRQHTYLISFSLAYIKGRTGWKGDRLEKMATRSNEEWRDLATTRLPSKIFAMNFGDFGRR